MITEGVLVAVLAAAGDSAAKTVFRGRPMVGIQERGGGRAAEDLTSDKGAALICTVSRIGDTYYWASRENRVLLRHDVTGYTTYFANDGSGYVKVVDPGMRDLLKDDPVPEAMFDYVEHYQIGLSTVTHYGRIHTLGASREHVGPADPTIEPWRWTP